MKRNILLLLVLLVFIGQASSLEESMILEDYELNYRYFESRAESGEDFTLTVTLKNTGEDKKDIEFLIDEEEPFYFDDDDFSLKELKEGKTHKERFSIEIDDDARSTTYELDFTLEDSEEKYEGIIEIKVDSIEPEFLLGNIEGSPGKITPDLEDIRLKITIENTGEGDAEFVIAELILPEDIESSNSFSDRQSLGTIASKSSKDATFYINTAKVMDKEEYTARLRLGYQNEKSQEKSSLLEILLPIKKRPLFELVSVSTEPKETITGSKENVLRLRIRNIGGAKGEETSVRIFDNVDTPFNFNEKTQRIGDIKPGESGEAVFTFDVESSAKNKGYIQEIETRTVNNENVITKSHSTRIDVTIRETPLMQYFIISSVVLIVILMGVLIFVLRR